MSEPSVRLDLAGEWRLRDRHGEYDIAMALPGDAHTALIAAGVIADPYEGRNEYAARWVAERDWIAGREFELDQAPERMLLILDQLDTVAEVRINDRVVLQANSSFRPHTADVAHALRSGANRIEILFRSNPKAADEAQAALPYFVPWHRDNCPIANGNMLRKPQCDFGWDWNIALAPFGLYGAVVLTSGAHIQTVAVRQEHQNDRVDINISVDVAAGSLPSAPWRISIGEEVAVGEATFSDGAARIETSLRIKDPQLWNPAGIGPAHVEPMRITVGDAEIETTLALRDIELVNEPDAEGLGFKLRVNGRDIFARGANWIPADALPGRVTKEKTRALLQSAADANMNMIRVWGGGRYEPDWFYEMCDELGLMVWQDFMFACHLYPSTPEFLSEVDREVRYQARRLSHRVALWCGDNELLGALNWFEASRQNRDRYLVGYDRLNRTIETALKDTDPQANWWPSSPSPGPMSFGDAWHDDASGDMHFWSVWHKGRDFAHYRDVRPRFCSEFGFQSFPSMSVIKSFAKDSDLNIASPVMESHQKNVGGNARIAETMSRYFRFPKSFEDFVWLSQVQHGLALKTAIDYWRSLKPRCMGTLYWQLNDTWPVASWASLDYGGAWKLPHYMARRFYQPVNVIALPDGENGMNLHGVNDTGADVEISVETAIVDLAGKRLRAEQFTGRVGQDAASLVTQQTINVADSEVALISWRASNGMIGFDHFAPQRYKAMDLPDPRLSIAKDTGDGDVRLQVSAAALAFFVTLEADRPGRFSDNAVAVAPGAPVDLTFRPDDGDPASVGFVTRDLHSSFSTAQHQGFRHDPNLISAL